jgi:hypothetical protein
MREQGEDESISMKVKNDGDEAISMKVIVNSERVRGMNEEDECE